MDLTLQPWLHQDVKDQLDLGHSWLDDKLKAKAKSAKSSTALDKKWESLYRDNGSCIDIIVPFCPEQAHVLVLKVSIFCCSAALLFCCSASAALLHPRASLILVLMAHRPVLSPSQTASTPPRRPSQLFVFKTCAHDTQPASSLLELPGP